MGGWDCLNVELLRLPWTEGCPTRLLGKCLWPHLGSLCPWMCFRGRFNHLRQVIIAHLDVDIRIKRNPTVKLTLVFTTLLGLPRLRCLTLLSGSPPRHALIPFLPNQFNSIQFNLFNLVGWGFR